MVISVGCDHCGFNLKNIMIPYIESLGHTVIDNGCFSADDMPYFPDVSELVCIPVLEKKADRGIIFCGTGVGAVIASNKLPGIRASVVHDIHSAHQCVEHDDVNVIAIGEKIVGEWLVYDLIERYFTATVNTDERTKIVLQKLDALDERRK